MTTEDLIGYLKDPTSLNKTTLPELEHLVETYPYAHTFVFLYLYNLAHVADIRYFGELQRWAPFLADRNKLYAMVEKQYLPHIELPKQEDSDDAFASIDRFLDRMEQQHPSVPSIAPDVMAASGDYFSVYGVPESSPVEESRAVSTELNESVRSEKDLYLPNAESESLEPAPAFTETLARIYIEQRCYDTALSIILSMKEKNPEKSSYFADQIRFLERLIDIDK